MESLTFTQKLCISVCWGFLLMYAAAEEQYFIGPHNASWEQARNHCQVCFKEMVTLTPQNVYIIGKMIDSDHWIGLRKYINYNGTYNDTYDYEFEEDSVIDPDNSTNTSSKIFGTPWTRWANGDPLIFQNWYPGYPVFKSPLPKIDCCSCSCTCPAPIRTTTTNPSTVQTTIDPPSGRAYRDPTGPNVTESDYENITDFTSFDDFENITDGTTFLSETNHTQVWESSTLQVHTTDSPWTTTPQPPILSTCERSPMLPPIVPENNENYIENSCVVILSFGPWVERVCTEELPFICYEERFMGSVNISNITSSSATVQWEEGPGDITYYRLEAISLKGSWNKTKSLTSLSDMLDGLTPGTGYKIQVFPVKCDRDLNPQNGSFYTIPGEVTNLTADNCSETSVRLSWNKPTGNYDFFTVTAVSTLVKAKPVSKDVKEDNMDLNRVSTVFGNLTQGNEYDFIVVTGVSSRDMWSENVSISDCTLPGKVSSLKAEDNTDVSLCLTWKPPEGNYADFKVKTFVNGYSSLLKVLVVNETNLHDELYKVQVSNLPSGNMISLSVEVRSNCNLTGKSVNITTYTAPGPIENLTLSANHRTINAEWDFHIKHDEITFTCELFSGNFSIQEKTSKTKKVTFDALKTSTNYTVKVYAVLNELKSPGTACSIFTLPSPPTDAKVVEQTTDSLTFEWTAPKNSSASKYICTLNSTYWNYTKQKPANKTQCIFEKLKSGSTYDFEVYTLSNGNISEPATCEGKTVKDETEINLSMLCSSEKPLFCDKEDTRKGVLEELKKYFDDLLGEDVYYKVDENSIITN